jgi:two-component system OmpR family sensor kinase
VSLRSRLSTSARVALTLTLTLAVGVVVLSAVAYYRVSERLRADLDRSLVREAEAFSAAMRQDIAPGADLQAATRAYLTARTGEYSSVRPVLLVRFASGRVISNSGVLLEHAAANTDALDPARASRLFLDAEFEGEVYRAATVPVTDTTGTVVAVFEAALPTSPTRQLGTELLWTLAAVGAVVGAVGALLSTVAARAALSPLRQAADTAERVTQSSLGERIDYEGPDDEVGRLARAVNSMLDRLEHAFGEQRRFVADASHELRTPLAVITGHLEIVTDPETSREERAHELALVSDEVARMGRLVDDLLALARLEAGPGRAFQPVELGTLLEEGAARARVLGDRNIEVVAPEQVWASGDPDGLMQAVLNLVVNAVAHTREGGLVRMGATVMDGRAVLSVEDDGPGIRRGDEERVFDRFYRAQGPRGARTGGSGLGLAVTSRIVELHCGTVSAANRREGGAMMTISLPAIDDPDRGTPV